jgi:hypothetical protein
MSIETYAAKGGKKTSGSERPGDVTGLMAGPSKLGIIKTLRSGSYASYWLHYYQSKTNVDIDAGHIPIEWKIRPAMVKQQSQDG